MIQQHDVIQKYLDFVGRNNDQRVRKRWEEVFVSYTIYQINLFTFLHYTP